MTSGNPSFRRVVAAGAETALSAYAHQDLPFEKLVEELQPERDLSRTPLFQTLFSLDDVRTLNWRLPGVTATTLELESATSKFDLSLLIENAGKKLQAAIEYNTDLFDELTILRERLATGKFIAKRRRRPVIADRRNTFINQGRRTPIAGSMERYGAGIEPGRAHSRIV